MPVVWQCSIQPRPSCSVDGIIAWWLLPLVCWLLWFALSLLIRYMNMTANQYTQSTAEILQTPSLLSSCAECSASCSACGCTCGTCCGTCWGTWGGTCCGGTCCGGTCCGGTRGCFGTACGCGTGWSSGPWQQDMGMGPLSRNEEWTLFKMKKANLVLRWWVSRSDHKGRSRLVATI